MHLAMALLSIGAQSPALPAAEAPPVAHASPLLGASLEDLLQTEVTSVSRKSQRLADTAAAVYVISAEDIAGSGATSLPEVLRMAPGVDAVRISGNRWAVSIRGLNDRFSNKLLVLINGRNAYSPAFSGVFWETLQLPLSDIQQIEVVRGPGAAAWGSNAVNGVINIITKPAAATHGTSVAVGGGTRQGKFGQLSNGGSLGDSDTHYRAYIRGQDSNSLERPNGDSAHDEFTNAALGLRLDGYAKAGGAWSVDVNAMQASSDGSFLLPVPTAPFVQINQNQEKLKNADFRARYTHYQGPGKELELQFSYAYNNYLLPLLGRDTRSIYDVDVQQRLTLFSIHELSLGAGYRYSSDKEQDGLSQRFIDKTDHLSVASVFIQDEIQLSEAFKGTLGVRLDDHSYTGLEWQPTARLLWNIDTNSSAWVSASRAVRTPSRGERTFTYTFAYQPPGIPVSAQGSNNFGSEYLNEYELGYRAQLTPSLFADSTVFYHQYRGLRTGGTPSFGPQGILLPLVNGSNLSLYGLESSTDWRIAADWRLKASYTYVQLAEVSGSQFSEAGALVKHLGYLNLGWRPLPALSIDGSVRYVADRRLSNSIGTNTAIPAFTTADLVIRWQLLPSLELSLVGQDLLETRHQEFQLTTPVLLTSEVQRGGYAQLRYQF